MVQNLEYEGLNNICYVCGTYGHSKENCGKSVDSPVPTANQQVEKSATPSGPSVAQPFGPWMVVDNSRRKTWAGNKKVNGSESSKAIHEGSHYAVLEEIPEENGSDFGPATTVLEKPQSTLKATIGQMRLVKEKSTVPQKIFIPNEAYITSNPIKKKDNVAC
ncbi:hypothetical protein V6N13_059330 [Hibiscus sabdariffa]|uniref:CCHC-type domain-containing protein n=1 Tax=Hibiscus sabdariffa TaxID=183260 RepID=A0ABR2GDS1_9ROSI